MRDQPLVAAPSYPICLPLPSLPATLGAYFAVRLCFSYLFFQSDPQLGAIVSFVLNMLLLVAIAFYTFGAAQRRMSLLFRDPCVRWVLAFLGFSLASLCWSETVSIPVALGYWSAMAADVTMVLLLLRSAAIAAMGKRILKGYVLGACLIACIMWLSPTMQDLRLGNDDFFSPNAIGFTCAFGVFIAQFLIRDETQWKWAAVFLGISLLRSLSKTTIAAFVVGELVLLFRDSTIRRASKVMLLSSAAAVVAVFWNLISAYYEVYTNAGNQAETLTGRIGIWGFVLQRALDRPWLGHGFHSFRNVIPPFGSFEAWHAHNELLQQFYAYGVVGIGLLIGLYGSFYLRLRRVSDPGCKSIFLGLILFICVRGLGDTERFDLSFPLWSIALISLMLLGSEGHLEVSL